MSALCKCGRIRSRQVAGPQSSQPGRGCVSSISPHYFFVMSCNNAIHEPANVQRLCVYCGIYPADNSDQCAPHTSIHIVKRRSRAHVVSRVSILSIQPPPSICATRPPSHPTCRYFVCPDESCKQFDWESASIALVAEPGPPCGCGKASVRRTVKKEGKNKGKRFYTCASSSCRFFEWIDTAPPPKASPARSGSSVSAAAAAAAAEPLEGYATYLSDWKEREDIQRMFAVDPALLVARSGGVYDTLDVQAVWKISNPKRTKACVTLSLCSQLLSSFICLLSCILCHTTLEAVGFIEWFNMIIFVLFLITITVVSVIVFTIATTTTTLSTHVGCTHHYH